MRAFPLHRVRLSSDGANLSFGGNPTPVVAHHRRLCVEWPDSSLKVVDQHQFAAARIGVCKDNRLSIWRDGESDVPFRKLCQGRRCASQRCKEFQFRPSIFEVDAIITKSKLCMRM